MRTMRPSLILALFLVVLLSVPSTYATDAYDPFIDYSEFDDNGDEEADINFFKNGRLFTASLVVGYTGFTGVLGQIYDPNVSFGVNVNFFLSLRTALQIQYLTSSHNLLLNANGGNFSASSTYSDISGGLKYYMNTQNIIRQLAQLNPYALLNVSHVSRTSAQADSEVLEKTTGFGLAIGGGIELALTKKFFIGVEGVYNLVSMQDEATEIVDDQGNGTGIFPSGDIYRVQFTIGANF